MVALARRSGFRSESVPLKSEEMTSTLTRWSFVPLNVNMFLWPGTVVVPIASVPSVYAVDVSAGTS